MALQPGLFARVLVKGKKTREVVLAPESAIVPRGGETFVFRIDAGKAIETKVKLGERHGVEVEILEGVMPNTQVVTAGQLKLRNGVAVIDKLSKTDPTTAMVVIRTLLDEAVIMLPDEEREKLLREFAEPAVPN